MICMYLWRDGGGNNNMVATGCEEGPAWTHRGKNACMATWEKPAWPHSRVLAGHTVDLWELQGDPRGPPLGIPKGTPRVPLGSPRVPWGPRGSPDLQERPAWPHGRDLVGRIAESLHGHTVGPWGPKGSLGVPKGPLRGSQGCLWDVELPQARYSRELEFATPNLLVC